GQARVRALRDRILAQLLVIAKDRQRIFQIRVSSFQSHGAFSSGRLPLQFTARQSEGCRPKIVLDNSLFVRLESLCCKTTCLEALCPLLNRCSPNSTRKWPTPAKCWNACPTKNGTGNRMTSREPRAGSPVMSLPFQTGSLSR